MPRTFGRPAAEEPALEASHNGEKSLTILCDFQHPAADWPEECEMARFWQLERAGNLETRWRRLFDAVMAYAILGAVIVVAFKLNADDPAPVVRAGMARVVDGDTLVLDGERLRLQGIDAPELDQTCEVGAHVLPCGRRARDALARLVAETVSCTGSRHDQYGRGLVSCSAAGGDIAARLVLDGQAVAYGCCEREEAIARAARRGLWEGRFDRPEDWRHAHPRHPGMPFPAGRP
jgi:endonuclease YncB( thermonuclease family)